MLSVSSSAHGPQIPYFSKENVALSVRMVVDGFVDTMYILIHLPYAFVDTEYLRYSVCLMIVFFMNSKSAKDNGFV